MARMRSSDAFDRACDEQTPCRDGGDFVLDTALVISKRVGEYVLETPNLEVDEVFRIATLESMGSGNNNLIGMTFTLYEGATPDRPHNGMYSFVPALPYDGNGPRFTRPSIELPGLVNPASKQAALGSARPRSIDEVREAWTAVLTQVLEQDLVLATHPDLGTK